MKLNMTVFFSSQVGWQGGGRCERRVRDFCHARAVSEPDMAAADQLDSRLDLDFSVVSECVVGQSIAIYASGIEWRKSGTSARVDDASSREIHEGAIQSSFTQILILHRLIKISV